MTIDLYKLRPLEEWTDDHGDVLLRLANAPAAQEGERADGPT